MARLWAVPLIVAIVGVAAGPAASAVVGPTPGAPCSDFVAGSAGPCDGLATPAAVPTVSDPSFVLANDPGTVDLRIFVVPGDVVLFEHSNGTFGDPTTWSDVVEFRSGPNSSTATTFPDGENGVLLPGGFALSSNAVSTLETQTGTGTDADATVYTAGSAVYQIHSDAALTPEPFEPSESVPEPSILALLVGGSLLLVNRTRR
jgi:hypothetical protein